MRFNDNISLYIIIAIVALHFIIGIAFLIYKIQKAPSSQPKPTKTDDDTKNNP
jgi:hypothetical protein